MFNLIDFGLPFSIFPYGTALQMAYYLIPACAIVGFVIMLALIILEGEGTPEIIAHSIKFIFLIAIVSLLYSTSLHPQGKTLIQGFVEGADSITTQIAAHLGGDPFVIAKQIWNDYAKQIMESKAFTDALNSNNKVGLVDKAVATIADSMIGFTTGIIHVCELAILAVFIGASAFVLIARKVLLDILLPIGFLVIPFIFIPIFKHWVKMWVVLVLETAFIVIPVSLIMAGMGVAIQRLFTGTSLNSITMMIFFLALLWAGAILILKAAQLTSSLLGGGLSGLSGAIAASKAASAGRGVTDMPIRHTASNIEQGTKTPSAGGGGSKPSSSGGGIPQYTPAASKSGGVMAAYSSGKSDYKSGTAQLASSGGMSGSTNKNAGTFNGISSIGYAVGQKQAQITQQFERLKK